MDHPHEFCASETLSQAGESDFVIWRVIGAFAHFSRPVDWSLTAPLEANDGTVCPAPAPRQQPEPEPLPEVTALEAVPDSYRWLALLVIAVIVLIAFALVLRRMRAARLMAMDETRESILSVDLLQDQLSKLLQSLLGRFRRAGEGLAFLSLSGEEATRRTIRSVYQQLLATTAAAGQPHQRSQTPQEYQAALEQAWSEKAARLAAITERYQEARYGGEVPSVEAAGEVERVWEEVQAELKGAG